MNQLEKTLIEYANENLNVIITGTHGIGKTMMVQSLAEKINLKFKYYSASTLDPYSELIGIPVPNKKTKTIEFYRPQDLENAEFIFFDELNRVTNPKVLNTVLEIIQFKSINGVPLKNLKMVWAAINPPNGNYQVEEMDPALMDRFHAYIEMKAEINEEYFNSILPSKLVKVLSDWWFELDENQKNNLTPRRMEYIGKMINKNLQWKNAIPKNGTFPIQELDKRLKMLDENQENLIINKELILNDPEKIANKLKTEDNFKKSIIPIFKIMKTFNAEELFTCRDIIENIPSELVLEMASIKWLQMKKRLKDLFEQNNVICENYQKIYKHFHFETIEQEIQEKESSLNNG